MEKKQSQKTRKVNKYRQALEEKAKNPSRHWTDITRSLNVGSYPYNNNFLQLSDRALDSISSAYSLIYGNDDVALAFKQIISKKFGLVDPDTMKEENVINFRLASVEDRDLIEQVENRKLYKDADGKWHRKKKQTIEVEELVEL